MFEQQEQVHGGKLGWVISGGLVLGIAAGALFFALRPGAPTPKPPEPPAATASAPAQRPAVMPTEQSDALVREWGAKVTSNELFAKFLAGRDLARQFAAAVQQVADGESPRRILSFLAPEGVFQVEERGGKTFIAKSSFARYDVIAAAIDTVDARVAAQAWQVVGPVVSAVYAEIAPPGASFDKTLDKAFTHLTSAPVPEGDVEVHEKGALFTYADPQFEQLTAAQKHLVRMGPENQRKVQAKLRELETALNLTVAAR